MPPPGIVNFKRTVIETGNSGEDDEKEDSDPHVVGALLFFAQEGSGRIHYSSKLQGKRENAQDLSTAERNLSFEKRHRWLNTAGAGRQTQETGRNLVQFQPAS